MTKFLLPLLDFELHSVYSSYLNVLDRRNIAGVVPIKLGSISFSFLAVTVYRTEDPALQNC